MAGPSEEQAQRDIGRLAAALGDPTRRSVFFAVRAAGRELGKDDVAAEVGIDRRLAGFHLDKLVEQGFLEAAFGRRDGRGGPGAGRPPKRYRLAESEVLMALPERHYELLAALLLRAAADGGSGSPQEVLERVGYDFGYEVGPGRGGGRRQRAGRLRLAGDPGRGAPALPLRLRGAGRRGRAACGRARAPSRRSPSTTRSASAASTGRSGAGMLAAFAPDATLRVATTRARGDEACVATVEA